MKTQKTPFLFLSILIVFGLISACTMEVSKIDDVALAPTEGVITATLYPTFTPRATTTPLPATAVPTIEPILGKATAQINIRKRPSTASESIGLLEINSEVLIIGRDEGRNWYQISFTGNGTETLQGWVSAEYILREGNADVPVTIKPSEGENGSVTQQMNVRSGPGTDYDPLGMLGPGDGIVLTGKNLDATWLQIEYASGPNARGWLFAAYVETDLLGELPVVDESGSEITGPTQTSVAATAAPVYTPAPKDGDTMEDPAILVTFSTSDSRAFSYSSDVSAPEGDFEDWISFHPDSDELRVKLLIDLTCSGNGTIYVELLQGGIVLKEWGELKCGDINYPLSLYRDETYQFRLYSKYSRNLLYTSYTLKMRVAP